MPQCAFLTTDDLSGYVCDDALAAEALAAIGWRVEWIPWRRTGVDWNRFDVVVIRSTWDYPSDPDAFLDRLEAIDRSTARLANPLSVVRWNLRKTYLQELQDRGIRIVPTRWEPCLDCARIADLLRDWNAEALVVKPVIGANAKDTRVIDGATNDAELDALADLVSRREFFVQAFMTGIVAEGEFSLFFFAGEYSHAILKVPKADDFRVQEEHGGQIRRVEPEPMLIDFGRQVLGRLDAELLYARIDAVRDKDAFALMELELIEPSLYFRIDPGSAARFAAVLCQWLAR